MPTSVRQKAGVLSALSILAMSISCDSERASLVLTINPVPSGTRKVNVNLSLDGNPLNVEPFTNNIPIGVMTMGFLLPPGATGKLDINIHVKGDGPCDTAFATAEASIDSLIRTDANLVLNNRAIASNVRQDLYTVWSASNKDIWVGGKNGTILNGDGECWYDYTYTSGLAIRAMSGTSSRDIWAVGDSGLRMHWNGNTWSEPEKDTLPDGTLTGVLSLDKTTVYAVGTSTAKPPGRLFFRYNGVRWEDRLSEIAAGTVPGSGAMNDIWGTNDNNLFLATDLIGMNSMGLLVKNPTWNNPSGGTKLLPALKRNKVHGLGPADVWFGGDPTNTGASILHLEGSKYSTFQPNGTTTGDVVTALWGPSTDYMLAAISPSTATSPKLYKYTPAAAAYNPLCTSELGNGVVINDISGSSATDAWLVGSGGTRIHFNGTACDKTVQ